MLVFLCSELFLYDVFIEGKQYRRKAEKGRIKRAKISKSKPQKKDSKTEDVASNNLFDFYFCFFLFFFVWGFVCLLFTFCFWCAGVGVALVFFVVFLFC